MDKLIVNLIEILKQYGQDVTELRQQDDHYEIELKKSQGVAVSPWRFFPNETPPNCGLWKSIIHVVLCKKILHKKDWFIPSGCQNCFKTVVKPRTYKELLYLEAVSGKNTFNSKCGIEPREYARGLYGGYFYAAGLEAGRKRRDEVREIVYEHIPIFLKRGCTEYEMEYGPSDKWEIKPHQMEIEAMVNENIKVVNGGPPVQDEETVKNIHEKWRKFAWKWDLSYNESNEYPPYVKY